MPVRLITTVARKAELWKAWKQVRTGSSPYSYGPDKITLREFNAAAHEHIKKIGQELLAGTFHFSKPRGHAIAKTSNAKLEDLKAWRPIVIPNICDRVVQRAILNVTWSRLRDHVCLEGSYGGIRPYRIRPQKLDARKVKTSKSRHPELQEKVERCVRAAAEKICELRQQGKQWVFETDIINFYPKINREKLLSRLEEVVEDDSLKQLFSEAVDTGISNFDEKGPLQSLWNPERGVPQGGILSPILANFYLAPLDRALVREGLSLVRYVDDLIVMCRDSDEARLAYEITKTELTSLDLEMHQLNVESNGKIKTRILEPGNVFSFLGLDFSAHAIRPTEAKFLRIEERIEEVTDVKNGLKLHEIVQRINLRLQGWLQAYKFCSLTVGDLSRIDQIVEKCVRRWLIAKGITEKRRAITTDAFSWLGLIKAASHPLHPILKPRKTIDKVSPKPDIRSTSLIRLSLDKSK